jgi:hypothetical protein
LHLRPELGSHILLLLFYAYALGTYLTAHLEELAIPVQRAIAALKVSEGTIKELMADFPFYLSQLMLGFKDIKRLLRVVAELQLAE